MLSSVKLHLLQKTFMYQLFCLLLAFGSLVSTPAQKCPIKGYAYQRATIPGIIPRKTLDESGKEIEAPVKMMNTYFIYVEIKRGCNLQVTRIWISGKAYHIRQEEVKNTPVVIHHTHPGTPADTLVMQTNNQVFRIQLQEEWNHKPDNKVISKYPGAKIIIEYIHKSRPVYYRIQDIKRIAPMVLQ